MAGAASVSSTLRVATCRMNRNISRLFNDKSLIVRSIQSKVVDNDSDIRYEEQSSHHVSGRTDTTTRYNNDVGDGEEVEGTNATTATGNDNRVMMGERKRKGIHFPLYFADVSKIYSSYKDRFDAACISEKKAVMRRNASDAVRYELNIEEHDVAKTLKKVAHKLPQEQMDEMGLDNRGRSPPSNASFEAMRLLDSWVVGKITSVLKLKRPTMVQAAAMPLLMSDERPDIVIEATTGTGKTLSYLCPIVDRIDTRSERLQAIILCPTRLLAMQISRIGDLFCGNASKTKRSGYPLAVQRVVGTVDEVTLKNWNSCVCHVLVTTPTTLLDFISRGLVNFCHLKYFVADEFDYLVDNFRDISNDILKKIRPQARRTNWRNGNNEGGHEGPQICLVTATMSDRSWNLANTFLRRRKHVYINYLDERTSSFVYEDRKVDSALVAPPNTLEHYVVLYKHKQQRDRLICRLSSTDPYDYGFLVFFNEFSDSFCVKDMLENYPVDVLELPSYGQRRHDASNAVRKISKRDKNVRMLLTTDKASRGLDMANIHTVINVGCPLVTPQHVAVRQYLHRAGRAARLTGRKTANGRVITLCEPKDLEKVRSVTQTAGIKKLILADVVGGVLVPLPPDEDPVLTFSRNRFPPQSFGECQAMISEYYGNDGNENGGDNESSTET